MTPGPCPQCGSGWNTTRAKSWRARFACFSCLHCWWNLRKAPRPDRSRGARLVDSSV